MYIFSANATARESRHGVEQGQRAPFIVYINFIDLFGAEQLCKIYLMREGFTDISIDKRKYVTEKLLNDDRVVQADKALQEAINAGYMIQLFEQE